MSGSHARRDVLGYVGIVLHAHLPYVRHAEQSGTLTERWLFETMTECYIPLLDVFERLTSDGVPYRIVVSLSPALLAMFADELLQERYSLYLERLGELAAREARRTRDDSQFAPLARLYQDRVAWVSRVYHDSYDRDLVAAFRRLAQAGNVELITSAATHAFLPLAGIHRSVAEVQVGVALDQFERSLGRRPLGFWLPECGYHPGLDQVLAENGLRWTCLEGHAVLFAKPAPRYGVHAPVVTPAGVACFGRDAETSKQVWSSREGYPGDPHYREYYRDIGYDLDYDYIRPFLAPDGSRTHTGFKYYRVTRARTPDGDEGNGDGGDDPGPKAPYDPEAAAQRAETHAGHFLWARQKQVEWLAGGFDRRPFILAPYDAELFGHWWFEGPRWLELFIRKSAYDQTDYALATPTDYLAQYPVNQPAQPIQSSWGWKGYSEVWLQGGNDWIYRHLHWAVEAMEGLVALFPDPDPLEKRALSQAGRELLLAQASDWPFMMQGRAMDTYAKHRFTHHLGRFAALERQLREKRIDSRELRRMEEADSLFPGLDYRLFAYRAWRPSPWVAAAAAGSG
jgi:1,4-alpha-glucan branching enzyme